MQVELHVSIDESTPLCKTEKKFLSFISSAEGISIKDNIIRYKAGKNEISVGIVLFTGVFDMSNQRYFDLTLENENEEQRDLFSSFVNYLKGIIESMNKGNITIHTLRDDIEAYYSIRGYPKIYETENLMRTLIDKFMLRHLGVNWFNKFNHQEANSKTKSKKGLRHKSKLHELDFKTLSEIILFKPYSTLKQSEIAKYINGIKETKDIKIEELKKIAALSNWERYFHRFFEEGEDKIKNQWEDLYDLRNLVAHNVGLNKSQYEKLSGIVKNLNPKLEEAISKLDMIIFPKGDVVFFMEYLEEAMEENPLGTALVLGALVLLKKNSVSDEKLSV